MDPETAAWLMVLAVTASAMWLMTVTVAAGMWFRRLLKKRRMLGKKEPVRPSAVRDAVAVAEHILWLRQPMRSNTLDLIKLAYIAHGWMLALYGRPLLAQPPEAWEHGVMVSPILRRYEEHRGDPIPLKGADRSADLDQEQRSVIEQVVANYAHFSTRQLSMLTSAKQTRWERTKELHETHAAIPSDLIRDFYGRLSSGQLS